jgi:hypothetical protein
VEAKTSQLLTLAVTSTKLHVTAGRIVSKHAPQLDRFKHSVQYSTRCRGDVTKLEALQSIENTNLSWLYMRDHGWEVYMQRSLWQIVVRSI